MPSRAEWKEVKEERTKKECPWIDAAIPCCYAAAFAIVSINCG